MKKNILIILFFIFQVSLAQEKTINEELKNEYNLMIQSESYKDFEQAVESYVDKLYLYKSFYDMCYEKNFLEVMKENMGSTSFKDYEEAEKEYFVLKEKYSLMKESNKGFYLALKNSNQWELADIISPNDKPEVDPCHCESSSRGSLNVLAFQYENVLKKKEESAVCAMIIYGRNKNIVIKARDLCRYGCEHGEE